MGTLPEAFGEPFTRFFPASGAPSAAVGFTVAFEPPFATIGFPAAFGAVSVAVVFTRPFAPVLGAAGFPEALWAPATAGLPLVLSALGAWCASWCFALRKDGFVVVCLARVVNS
jgi:hypothetical protein